MVCRTSQKPFVWLYSSVLRDQSQRAVTSYDNRATGYANHTTDTIELHVELRHGAYPEPYVGKLPPLWSRGRTLGTATDKRLGSL
jgi:hypothetical protein